jgi:glutathione S-transferase
MLTLYGHSMSRAHRVLWLLREIGIPFDHVPTDFLHDGNKTPEFLRLNPNGKVPVLTEGDLVLFESLAINLYLAKRYGGTLGPQSPAEDALMTQWALWTANEVEKTLFVACENLFFFAEPERRPQEAELALAKLDRPFRVLDGHLSKCGFVVGGRFSVADINAASVMTLIPICGVDISAYAGMQEWLDRCLARPAADDYKPIRFTVPRPKTEANWMQSLM